MKNMNIALVFFLIAMFVYGRSARPDAHVPQDTWCLMAWTEEQVRPDCIRTFDSYGWCMFDLKTMVDENALVPVRFSCHREDIWRPLYTLYNQGTN